jgi:hypothetical protein
VNSESTPPRSLCGATGIAERLKACSRQESRPMPTDRNAGVTVHTESGRCK